ncbi:hypothetical protein GCM10028808_49550 [Spirosoma migulaei]
MISFTSVKAHIANIITVVFPPKRWYKAAYLASGMLAFLRPQEKYTYKNTLAISRAGKLNGLLAIMTRKGKPFPIPVLAQGLELFLKHRPNGLILCSTHIPLSKVALRYLIEQGFKPTVAIAGNPGVIDSIAVWGSIEKIPAIRTGPFVLQKSKSVLQQGGTVVVLVDKLLGGPYSPNIFILGEKLNSDIIFFNAALQNDGTIVVNFHESEWNGSDCKIRVHQQMNELYQFTTALLKHYGNSYYLRAPLEVQLQKNIPTTI